MDAEHWAAVERLYHAARERRDAGERAAFLDQACANEAALRAEVESLLAHDPDTSAFMEVPAVAQLAGDMAGATARFEGVRFGPYKLGALLGAGGMGEVYRAEDTRLGREVAVKVLPAYLSTDPARRARLEREARAIAAVTHPNICALYDVGREGDVEFLVLEYVQGDTLAGRLTRGAMPLDEALAVARDMAAALAAAHASGIVHRDLKPANVVLTRAGAKLLDFGLAKLADPAAASSASRPTAASLTEIGSILGTLQYMSPEQVEGQEADARSDIFAFGAILHEMVSGVKAFEGKSQASLIAAILEREPTPLPQLRPETPPVLARVVRTCLAKDPAQRWQSAVDLERELAWVREDLGSGTLPRAALPVRRGLRLPIGWSIAAAATVIAIAAWLWRGPASAVHDGAPMQLALRGADLPSEFARFPTISPDGRHVVFVETHPAKPEDSRMWLHDFATAESRPVEGTVGAAFPFWSPDSRSVAFFAGASLKRLDVQTGSIQTLCDAAAGRGGSWAPDDTILFSPDTYAPLLRISAQGGPTAAVTRLDAAAQDRGHRLPFFLADGRHFVFTKIKNSNANVLAVGSLDASATTDIVSGRGLATQAVLAGGKLLYVSEGALVAQDFDSNGLVPRGDRVTLVRRVYYDGPSHVAFSVSSTGTIVYRTVAPEITQIAVVSRVGKLLRSFGEAAAYDVLSVSPDGAKLAVSRVDPATDFGSVWLVDVRGGQMVPLTSGADTYRAVWSADGKRILYARATAWAVYSVHAVDVESGRDEVLIRSEDNNKTPQAWLPDGSVLYTMQNSSGPNQTLWHAKPGSPGPGESIGTALNPSDARLSPDRRWLAYTSIASGRAEIFVQGFPTGPRQAVTNGGGTLPQWRADGHEMYYVTEEGTKLNAAAVRTSPSLEVATPTVLFQIPRGSSYVPAPDGKTFYVALAQPTSRSALMVLVNWLGVAPKR